MITIKNRPFSWPFHQSAFERAKYVIYVDFDGVINGPSEPAEPIQFINENGRVVNTFAGFIPRLVNNLKEFSGTYGEEMVFICSSTWRISGYESVMEIFSNFDWEPPFVACTPLLRMSEYKRRHAEISEHAKQLIMPHQVWFGIDDNLHERSSRHVFTDSTVGFDGPSVKMAHERLTSLSPGFTLETF